MLWNSFTMYCIHNQVSCTDTKAILITGRKPVKIKQKERLLSKKTTTTRNYLQISEHVIKIMVYQKNNMYFSVQSSMRNSNPVICIS